jgi:hypothetical protein
LLDGLLEDRLDKLRNKTKVIAAGQTTKVVTPARYAGT